MCYIFEDLLALNNTITCNSTYPEDWFEAPSVCDDALITWFKERAKVVQSNFENDGSRNTAIFKVDGRLLGVRGDTLIYPWSIGTYYFFEMEEFTQINYKIKLDK